MNNIAKNPGVTIPLSGLAGFVLGNFDKELLMTVHGMIGFVLCVALIVGGTVFSVKIQNQKRHETK